MGVLRGGSTHASRMKRNSGSRNPHSMERKVGRQRKVREKWQVAGVTRATSQRGVARSYPAFLPFLKR